MSVQSAEGRAVVDVVRDHSKLIFANIFERRGRGFENLEKNELMFTVYTFFSRLEK